MSEDEEERRRRLIIRQASESSALTENQRGKLAAISHRLESGETLKLSDRQLVGRLVGKVARSQ